MLLAFECTSGEGCDVLEGGVQQGNKCSRVEIALLLFLSFISATFFFVCTLVLSLLHRACKDKNDGTGGVRKFVEMIALLETLSYSMCSIAFVV